jgi:hypothetical protein
MLEGREVRATLLGAVILLAYTSLVLLSGRVALTEFTLLFLTYVGGGIALWVVLGVVFMLASIVRGARSSGSEPFLAAFVRESLLARWRRDKGASLLWPPLLFAGLMASFNSFKQMVLPLAGFRFDHALAEADRLLFLGQDGWQVTHALFSSPAATIAIDGLYHSWFVPVALGVILCAWLPASTYRVRTQYLLSYMAVWIVLGSFGAFLMPAAGPCFHAALVGPAPEFEALMQRLRDVQALTGSRMLALHNQDILWRAHIGDGLALGGGISAMPSVHNALAVLFAIAGWRISRLLGVVLAAYALGIWIGSIHLGWHYAVDGIVAAIATLAIWHVCGRIADRLERPLLRAEPQTALA